MKLPRNAKIFRGQLDTAPFAAVSFLLLIFLMLSSKIVSVPGVRIELPELPADLPGTSNPTIVLAVTEHGQLYYENQAISLADLPLRLRRFVHQVKQPVTLVIKADKAARLEILVPLMNAAREAGIREVLLPTRAPAKAKSASAR
jgi:biopolymer transport protein ExbD